LLKSGEDEVKSASALALSALMTHGCHTIFDFFLTRDLMTFSDGLCTEMTKADIIQWLLETVPNGIPHSYIELLLALATSSEILSVECCAHSDTISEDVRSELLNAGIVSQLANSPTGSVALTRLAQHG
jgi:hypothetical protein